MMWLAYSRKVFISLEQPLNSILFLEAGMQLAIRMTDSSRLLFWMGGWGADSPKPIELYTTFPASAKKCLVKSKKESDQRLGTRKQFTDDQPRATSSDGSTGWSSSAWVVGNKAEIKESEIYPDSFTDAFSATIVSLLSKTAQENTRLTEVMRVGERNLLEPPDVD